MARGLALLVPTALLLTACGGGPTAPAVPAAAITQDLTQKVTEVAGAPEGVECEDDLKGEVGAESECTVNVNNVQADITVQVMSIEGDTVKYDLNIESVKKLENLG